jgi:hypothetical protein
VPTMVALRGSWALWVYQAGSLASDGQDYMCGIDYINILCKYLTD